MAHSNPTIQSMFSSFGGARAAGDTTGNNPGTRWTAFNAIAEHPTTGEKHTGQPGEALAPEIGPKRMMVWSVRQAGHAEASGFSTRGSRVLAPADRPKVTGSAVKLQKRAAQPSCEQIEV